MKMLNKSNSNNHKMNKTKSKNYKTNSKNKVNK